MRKLVSILALAAVLGGLSGCATGGGAPESAARTEVGIASYYGREFEGRRTASGDRYHADALTAAHRTLPFGTRVRVTNLSNGRNVEVTVNDRGPFRKERVVDVSRRAARSLGFLSDGTARVRLEVLGR